MRLTPKNISTEYILPNGMSVKIDSATLLQDALHHHANMQALWKAFEDMGRDSRVLEEQEGM